MNLSRLARTAKRVVEKRGGMDALKQDAEELKKIAKSEGSFGAKAGAAVKAIKDSGAPDEPEGSAEATDAASAPAAAAPAPTDAAPAPDPPTAPDDPATAPDDPPTAPDDPPAAPEQSA
jgi:hypothetical protein